MTGHAPSRAWRSMIWPQRSAQAIGLISSAIGRAPGMLRTSLHVIEVPAISRATSATTPGSASTTCPAIETTSARESAPRAVSGISALKLKRERQGGGARAGDRALRVPRAREFHADNAQVPGLQPLCLVSTVHATDIA